MQASPGLFLKMETMMLCDTVLSGRKTEVLEESAVSVFRVEVSQNTGPCIYQATQHHISEDHNLNFHHSENLKSHIDAIIIGIF
jgi:hypothetical protein